MTQLRLAIWFAIVALMVPCFASASTAPVMTNSFQVVRASAILTTSYVSSSAIDTKFSNQILCYVDATIGSLTSIELVATYGNTASGTFYDDAIVNSSVGATTADEFASPLRTNVLTLLLSSAGVSPIAKVLAFPNLGKFMKLKVKGTGTVTNSLVAISCYAGAV